MMPFREEGVSATASAKPPRAQWDELMRALTAPAVAGPDNETRFRTRGARMEPVGCAEPTAGWDGRAVP